MHIVRCLWLIATLIMGASVALAENDHAVRVQIQNPQAKAARPARQPAAALRAPQRQGRCQKERGSGLLDPCRDLAARSAAVGSDVATGRSGLRLAARSGSQRRVAGLKFGGSRQTLQSGGNLFLFCVRLSDGYFFPAPNSQFAGYGDYDGTLDRCRFICQDPAMDVYVLDDVQQETDALRPMKGGKLYRELPIAFAYADEPKFQGCNFQRYFQRSSELQARSNAPDEGLVPLPTRRPDPNRHGVLLSAVASSEDSAPRKVRVIGQPFLPDIE